MYVYIQSERELWTVGFYDPHGFWRPESDWESAQEAASRVHYLNGGRSAEDQKAANSDTLYRLP
jgi:hypothetical protein